MSTVTLPRFDPDVDAVEPAVSKHELSRFLAGECTPERRAHIEAALASDPALRAKADELVAEERAFRAAIPLERFLADHAAKTASRFAWLKSLRIQTTLGLAVVMSAAALFLVVRGPDDGVERAIREKGGRVGFFVRDHDSVHPGTAGEQLGEGDQVQFAVRDDVSHSAMVLVGVDGRGVVTVYDAEAIDHERAKGAEKARLLPDSVVLDDATGAERFFVVYGDGAVDAVRATVEHAAQELASAHADLASTERLPLSKSYVQSSVHIVKVAR